MFEEAGLAGFLSELVTLLTTHASRKRLVAERYAPLAVGTCGRFVRRFCRAR